jgi:cation transport regulator ChaC
MKLNRQAPFFVSLFCLDHLSTCAFLMTTSAKMPILTNAQKNPPPRRRLPRNFVFGYGSLICPESRKLTNPSLGEKDGLPVIVQDVERVWSARTKNGYTAMGVRFNQGTDCTGVLIEVTPAELEDLDRREANYDRKSIQLDNIDQVPFLDEEEHYDDDHPVFEAQDEDNDKVTEDMVNVWVYIQQNPILADPSHPIPQTYVDIILRGCLSVGGEEFARSFIETTSGWNGDKDDTENEHWVDDRDDPLYVRADAEFSEQHGERIDELLEDQKPKAFENRVEYDPKDHLEALEEEDMAYPKAIKRIESKVMIAEAEENDATATS